MQAWRHVQPSGTNRPSSSRPTPSSRREVAGARSHVPHDVGFRASRSGMGRVRLTRRFRYAPARAPGGDPGTFGGQPPVRPAAMEEGTHPDPSRTRKLSLPSPMVLRRQAVGEQDAAGRTGGFSIALAGPARAGPFSFPGRGVSEQGPHRAGILFIYRSGDNHPPVSLQTYQT